MSLINWLETNGARSDVYDQAFSETILDALDFSEECGWKRVQGGMDHFAHAMKHFLQRDEHKVEIEQGVKVKKIVVEKKIVTKLASLLLTVLNASLTLLILCP